MIQNLYEFWQFFLPDLFEPKCPNIPKPKNNPEGNMS